MALTFRCLVDDCDRCNGSLEFHVGGKCECHCHKREGGETVDGGEQQTTNERELTEAGA